MATKRIREPIRHWRQRGYSTNEIAEILHLPEQEVTDIILDRGQQAADTPEFIAPPLFDLEDHRG